MPAPAPEVVPLLLASVMEMVRTGFKTVAGAGFETVKSLTVTLGLVSATSLIVAAQLSPTKSVVCAGTGGFTVAATAFV